LHFVLGGFHFCRWVAQIASGNVEELGRGWNALELRKSADQLELLVYLDLAHIAYFLISTILDDLVALLQKVQIAFGVT
jgi:hypothetical protein